MSEQSQDPKARQATIATLVAFTCLVDELSRSGALNRAAFVASLADRAKAIAEAGDKDIAEAIELIKDANAR